MKFAFSDNEKFSFIAVDNCFTDIECDAQLTDGTIVLAKLPTAIDEWWIRQIGEIRLERLTAANLILLRRVQSDKPQILDEEHTGLFSHLLDVWWTLQLSGVAEYEDASAMQGSFESGKPHLRQMVHLDHYYQTTSAPRTAVTIPRLEEACTMAATWRTLVDSSEYDRFVRGGVVLRDGFQERHGQERVHQFVRAIEALILPRQGKTARQFFDRCQTLGVRGRKAEGILSEAWEMRCDVEHLHSAARSLLKKYSEDQWEQIAHMRTRQMEVLDSESYRRILTSGEIRSHFESDEKLAVFWKLAQGSRQKIWGTPIDVTGFQSDDRETEMIRELREKYE